MNRQGILERMVAEADLSTDLLEGALGDNGLQAKRRAINSLIAKIQEWQWGELSERQIIKLLKGMHVEFNDLRGADLSVLKTTLDRTLAKLQRLPSRLQPSTALDPSSMPRYQPSQQLYSMDFAINCCHHEWLDKAAGVMLHSMAWDFFEEGRTLFFVSDTVREERTSADNEEPIGKTILLTIKGVRQMLDGKPLLEIQFLPISVGFCGPFIRGILDEFVGIMVTGQGRSHTGTVLDVFLTREACPSD
ncbi:hypothetical protein WJX73_008856 [Symbiochloris irregularis]|uniref:Uncharacterized protein n=1 Tax=Symbiochloris irregularis TaxID=706552 RepID=A0AAW1NKJ7_9CHLO